MADYKGFDSKRLGLSYKARYKNVSPNVETEETLPLSQHMYNVAILARTLAKQFKLSQQQRLLTQDVAFSFRLHEVSSIAFSDSQQKKLRETHTQAQIGQLVRDAIAEVLDQDPELRDVLFAYYDDPCSTIEYGIVWFADKVQEVLFLLGQLYRGNRFLIAPLVQELKKLENRYGDLVEAFPNQDWDNVMRYVVMEVVEKTHSLNLDDALEETQGLLDFFERARELNLLQASEEDPSDGA